MDDRVTRRRLLGALAAGATGFAGCAGGERASSTTPSPESTADGGTAAATGTDGTEAGGSGTGTDAVTPTGTPLHAGYDTTEVVVETPDGERLGAVTAAIADTADLRYTGLSDTESLPADRGMLFVYDSPQADLTYVMRRMSFGIDIVFADGDGTINTVHHASEPGPNEDGNDQRYPGEGQYVLEVTYDWTSERGVEVGDVLRFDL